MGETVGGEIRSGDTRDFGPEVRARCALGEAALRAATSGGSWANGAMIARHWETVHRSPVPPAWVGRWPRILEPALTAGHVVTRRAGRHVYYAFATDADRLVVPRYGSDLERIETAHARAVDRLGGAVPVEAVESEIEADPALALETTTLVAVRLASLERTGRIRAVRPAQAERGQRGRVYYTTLHGPKAVAPEAELAIDRRVRAIRSLWRRSGGYPFTTRAVTEYAAAHDAYRIPGDPAYGWTNALQHLGRTDFLRCLDGPHVDPYFVRWAPAREWDRLPDSVRADRLGISPETVATPVAQRGADAAGPVKSVAGRPSGRVRRPRLLDVDRVSRNRELRHLVQSVVDTRAAREVDPERRLIRLQQPVTMAEARAHLEARRAGALPLLAGADLTGALAEAVRVRNGMRVSAVARIGTVRNVTYFAEPTNAEHASAYVAFLHARAVIEVARYRRVLGDIDDGIQKALSGVLPVSLALLAHRLALFLAEVEERRTTFEAALLGAPLLPEERDEAALLVAGLRELGEVSRSNLHAVTSFARRETGRDLSAVADPGRLTWRLPHHVLLDTRVAWAVAKDGAWADLSSPRAVWSVVRASVRAIRLDDDVMDDTVMEARVGATRQPHLSGDRAAVMRDASAPSARRTRVAEGAQQREDAQEREEAQHATVARTPSAYGAHRRLRTYLDRVEFSGYARYRWGSGVQANMASQAREALGGIRRAEVLIAELEGVGDPATDGVTVGALGLLGTHDARAAVARFLQSGVSRVRRITVGDAVTAALWLGPAPIGQVVSGLDSVERAALEAAVDQGDRAVRRAAERSLRAWSEAWPPRRLLIG